MESLLMDSQSMERMSIFRIITLQSDLEPQEVGKE
jgi:hypothetical protein